MQKCIGHTHPKIDLAYQASKSETSRRGAGAPRLGAINTINFGLLFSTHVKHLLAYRHLFQQSYKRVAPGSTIVTNFGVACYARAKTFTGDHLSNQTL